MSANEEQKTESPKERILLKEYSVGFTKFVLFLNPNGYLRINQENDGEYRGGITIAPATWNSIGRDVHYYVMNKERWGRDIAAKILQTDYEYYDELRKKENE